MNCSQYPFTHAHISKLTLASVTHCWCCNASRKYKEAKRGEQRKKEQLLITRSCTGPGITFAPVYIKLHRQASLHFRQKTVISASIEAPAGHRCLGPQWQQLLFGKLTAGRRRWVHKHHILCIFPGKKS